MKIIGNKIEWDETDGPGLYPIWMTVDDPFYGPSLFHDLQYQLHKCSKSKTRKQIDDDFLNKCILVAQTLSSGNTKLRQELLRKADRYYSLVRWFGWISWMYKRNCI